MSNLEKGVWFVYDGECVLCTKAATALRIKETYGALTLLNAREHLNHELLLMIKARQLDLDEGMVIYHQGEFFHGATALQFMAEFSEATGWFNWANKLLFWSKSLAKLMYPWMRGIRNKLVKGKNIARIDNLAKSAQPAFESTFGSDWQHLPLVLKRHYQPVAYSDQKVTFEGLMNIKCNGPIKWFSPLLWLLGGIPPKTENNVPVEVSFISQKNELALVFDRKFSFKKHKKPYRFKSKLYPYSDGKVVEVMKFGTTWKTKLYWDEDSVKMVHAGYALKWFGHLIPLPLAWLFGTAYAEEIAVDDNSFDMSVTITHPWWGEIYNYAGRFTFVSE